MRLNIEVASGVTLSDIDQALAQDGVVHRVVADGGPEAVFLDPEFIRALTKKPTPPDWDAGFERMLEFARSSGWWDQDIRAVRIHVESSSAA